MDINCATNVKAKDCNVTIRGMVTNLTCINSKVTITGIVKKMTCNGKDIPQVPVKEVIRDRIVYKSNFYGVSHEQYRELEKEKKRLEKSVGELKERNAILEDANHEQAERIKKLERIIEEHREKDYRSYWDCCPSKRDCERLVRIFDLDVFGL